MKTNSLIKFTLALIVLSAFSFQSYSQVKWGVKADVGLNNPSFNSEALKVENMTSFSVGPTIEAMILPLGMKTLGIEASLLYNDNRMKVENVQNGGNMSEEISNRYLNLPVNAKLKFGLGLLPVRMFVAAGPYAALRVGGDKINFSDVTEDIKSKSFQAGVNIGMGVEVLKMIQVGINYSGRLTDNYSVDRPNWKDPLNGKSSTWSITGAVYF
ncbi:MAG: porin family protein [Fermentimonas sp.]|jgi:hypothetical protein